MKMHRCGHVAAWLIASALCAATARGQTATSSRSASRTSSKIESRADLVPIALPATPASRWTAVRVTKWALLAAAVGFGSYALQNSRRADDAYEALGSYCHEDQERCRISGGRYADAQAERLYQRSRESDRNARTGIIGGQVSLIGSAALFVYDLRNGRGPSDIPYPAGERQSRRSSIVVGARLAF